MDWSRAKNILIIAFILLNVFLFANIVGANTGNGISRKVLEDTERILTSRGVQLNKGFTIPTTGVKAEKLLFGAAGFDREAVVKALLGIEKPGAGEVNSKAVLQKDGKTVSFVGDHRFIYEDKSPGNPEGGPAGEKAVRNLLSGAGIHMENFIRDYQAEDPSDPDKLVFIEKYKSFLVYDNQIRVRLAQGKIQRIECSICRVKGFAGPPVEIIPAYQVLIKKIVSEGDVILQMDLGYKGYASDWDEKGAMELSQGPAWRVVLKGREPSYFRAYDGEELK